MDTERIRRTSERLEIRARPGYTAGTWLQSFNSTVRFDLTASQARVEVVTALNSALNTTTFLTAFNTATKRGVHRHRERPAAGGEGGVGRHHHRRGDLVRRGRAPPACACASGRERSVTRIGHPGCRTRRCGPTRRFAATTVTRGEAVVRVLAELVQVHGEPGGIRSDNGSEFTAAAVKDWLASAGIKTLYIERGSPWENGYAESFNSRFRVSEFYCRFHAEQHAHRALRASA